MEVSEYVGFVASEGELFAAAAEHGDLNVDVPPCAGWDIRELVRHLGMIHLWAAGNVAFPKDDWLEVDDLPDLAGLWPDLAQSWPDDANLVSWYRATLANLVRVLESAPADVECFTFLPATTPLTMWARRQASEIAIHRFDAEVSRGITSRFDPNFATDMLDELLSGFAPRTREIDVEAQRQLHIHAQDVGEHWYLTIGPKGIETTRDGDGDGADLTVTGTVADLYLLFWNRIPDSTADMEGDADLMDVWHNNCRVRWS
jgi:uncharacterized protein (TIGR03083 family)